MFISMKVHRFTYIIVLIKHAILNKGKVSFDRNHGATSAGK